VLILLQWSQAAPQDWTSIDLTASGQGARRWRDLPKRPVPTGGETIDNQPGWIFDVCIQGWCLRGADHIAAEPISGGGIRVYRWFDDLDDDETDYFHGQVIEFRPGYVDRTLTLPDGSTIRHRGPDQRMTEYASDMEAHRPFVPTECGGLAVPFRPWSEWVMPPANLTLHGIWLSDSLLREHMAKQRPVDWREWVA
jgi:hypothetical protein